MGIWYGVDPKADDFLGFSPYNYCFNNPLGHVDPDGQAPWLVGAAIGATMDYACQVAINKFEGKSWGESLTNINMGSLAVAAVSGAVGAGFAEKIGTLSKVGQAITNGVINGASNVASQAVTTGKVDLGQTVVAVGVGQIIGNKLGAKAAASPETKTAVKALSKTTRLAANNPRLGRQLQKVAAQQALNNVKYVKPTNQTTAVTAVVNSVVQETNKEEK